MIDFIKKSVAAAFAVVTGIFTFVPESFFASRGWITQELLNQCKWISGLEAEDVNIIISRLACFSAHLDCHIGGICAFSETPPMDDNTWRELYDSG